jgi:dihydrofolate synthase/folylpolyglutamate synthase
MVVVDHLGHHRGSPALAYLESRVLHGVKFGLETVRALLAALAHPEHAFATLLVAGTNGKGSVVAYLDSLLRASGHRVGRYTSPHLERVNERIAVEGEEISDDELESRVTTVRETAESLIQRGEIADHPTYFEALTVAALHHFRERRVGVGVLEVGMVGRLDATNVCAPIVSAIVTVAHDHEQYLGHTLAQIAREKAGVLRPGRPTVLGRLPTAAEDAIAAEADRVGAQLVRAHDGVSAKQRGTELDVHTATATYSGLRPLPGAHQWDNLIVALRTLEEARRGGLAVDLQGSDRALAAVRWPGRLELFERRPPILLDGAHNPAAAAALAEFLRATRASCVLIFGAMRDKDIGSMAQLLFPLARSIVLTRPATARAATPDEIAGRSAALVGSAHRALDSRSALALARTLARSDETIVVAGSLYLVGEIRGLLTREAQVST